MIVLAMCLTIFDPLWAEDLSVSAFLKTARYDGALEQADEKCAFLSTASSNTPYIEEIEFRTATEDFRATDQKYRLRVRPSGWGETAAGEDLFHTTVAQTEAQRDLILHQALTARYVIVVDYIHARTELALHHKRELLEQDRRTVLRNSIDAIGFDVKDLIEVEDDLIQLQIMRPELENRLYTLGATIEQYAGPHDEVDFNAGSLLPVSDIERIIGQVDGDNTNTPDNINLKAQWLRVERDRCRYELEKSQSRRYVSFLEASYDNKDREHAREAYSIELGIELPFVNSDRLDINQRKLAYLTEKSRYEEAKHLLERERQVLQQDLTRLIAHYNRITEGGMSEAGYRHAAGLDPLVVLKIQESRVLREAALNDLRHDIYRTYVELLDVTGTLSRRPIRNYLSTAQEELDL
jgi:hypothetical protein